MLHARVANTADATGWDNLIARHGADAPVRIIVPALTTDCPQGIASADGAVRHSVSRPGGAVSAPLSGARIAAINDTFDNPGWITSYVGWRSCRVGGVVAGPTRAVARAGPWEVVRLLAASRV